MKHGKVVFVGLALLVMGLWVGNAFANSAGPPDNHAANPPGYNNCTLCHGTFPVNSGMGAVFMVFPPISYVSGATIPVDISVSDPTATRWGFEMTCTDGMGNPTGQFIVIDPAHSQLSGNYMKQTSFGTFPGSGFGVAWPILWTAPVSAFPVTFYLAGCAADNDGTNNGDYIYTDSLVVNAASPVYIDLTAIGTTTFPDSGGILTYDIEATSWSGLPADTIDIWVDVTLPYGTIFGPVLGPVLDFPMPGIPPPQSVSRTRTLTVPLGAPAGNYTLNAYIGQYSPPNNLIMAEDHFPFDKTALDGDLTSEEAVNFVDSGEEFEELIPLFSTPDEHLLLKNHPNPFNPTTVISFSLPVASLVKLDVFDINGRNVGFRESDLRGHYLPGTHQITFDGSDLASGIYIYRLTAGDFTASGKMVLMK
ncbi:hypothetical protein CEE37_09500 [candidate division LCP-89 bacterium B3_LCP]|uniref:Cytochrome c domain-containing protein n=1 Tax=candidate division LCP-89 bacterium B3_LCP TaxID=2012998 RepID=A0A532UYD0_UNCL8|nr:MAG: hypothetical protein CEE37_09500 [candidate division LCP-89 bacterium B3_LCP]